MSRVRASGVLLCGVLAGLASCIFPPKSGDGTGAGGGENSGGGGSGGGDGGVKHDGAAKDAPTVGTMCDVTTTSGTMLCETVSTCPKLTVNQNTWNGCGFLIMGKVFSLVCECSGYICVAAAAPTCSSAGLILETESASQVCGQLSNGGCNEEFLPLADAGPGQMPPCDSNCTSQCNGDPTCIQGCGC